MQARHLDLAVRCMEVPLIGIVKLVGWSIIGDIRGFKMSLESDMFQIMDIKWIVDYTGLEL